MNDHPILFSGPMVREIFDGRKTQTRRIAAVNDSGCKPGFITPNAGHVPRPIAEHAAYCPYGKPGDRLWVRETGWERPERTPRMMREGADTWAPYYYDADGLTELDHEQFKAWKFKRRPSIFMPRRASRLTLEITSVRVERLQAISEQDALAEGVRSQVKHSAAFADLWDSINAKRGHGWDTNPWVWVVEFKRI